MAALLALVVAVAALGCSFGGGDEDAGLTADFVVDLVRGESGRAAGTVGLYEEPGGKTRIEIFLAERATGQQAEIRSGNCDVQNLGVVYTFPPLVEGRSQRVVDVRLRDVRRSGYLVLVHDAEGVGGVCGDLARSQPPGTPTFE